MDSIGVGAEVGGYRLERLLGGGGFGDVWLARDARGSLAAIKLLRGAYASGEMARLRAEVELLAASAAARSPHVVRVLGGGTEPLPYVVMEYVEGSDLAELLTVRGALPQEEALRIGRSIADALAALEAVGIVHRDVKPANVLIDTVGTVKLSDFGIAKIVGYESVTMTGQMPLSMVYAAPEVWEGRPSHRSDLYALGIVLYQCLVGEPPFSGTFASIYRAHREEHPDLSRLPDGIVESLRSLIEQLLSKDEESRPAHATTCRAALDAAAAELDRRTQPEGVQEPQRFGPWERMDRHPEQPWAFLCRDGQRYATVELHFTDDISLGDRLRRALEANARLAPYGAGPLLGANRFLARPGEGWDGTPPGTFQFWVARAQPEATATTEQLDLDEVRRIVADWLALGALASEAQVSFSPSSDDIEITSDGRLRVSRIGLPPVVGASAGNLLTVLQQRAMTDAAATEVRSAGSLDELAKRLDVTPMTSRSGVANAAGATTVVAPADSAIVAAPTSRPAPSRPVGAAPPSQPPSPPAVTTVDDSDGPWRGSKRVWIALVSAAIAVALGVSGLLASQLQSTSDPDDGGGTVVNSVASPEATDAPTSTSTRQALSLASRGERPDGPGPFQFPSDACPYWLLGDWAGESALTDDALREQLVGLGYGEVVGVGSQLGFSQFEYFAFGSEDEPFTLEPTRQEGLRICVEDPRSVVSNLPQASGTTSLNGLDESDQVCDVAVGWDWSDFPETDRVRLFIDYGPWNAAHADSLTSSGVRSTFSQHGFVFPFDLAAYSNPFIVGVDESGSWLWSATLDHPLAEVCGLGEDAGEPVAASLEAASTPTATATATSAAAPTAVATVVPTSTPRATAIATPTAIATKEPVALTAHPHAPIQEAWVGFEVEFQDHTAGDVTARTWDFGDGTTSIEKNPTHTYVSAGVRTVRLRVCNSTSCSTGSVYVSIKSRSEAISSYGLCGRSDTSIRLVDRGVPNPVIAGSSKSSYSAIVNVSMLPGSTNVRIISWLTGGTVSGRDILDVNPSAVVDANGYYGWNIAFGNLSLGNQVLNGNISVPISVLSEYEISNSVIYNTGTRVGQLVSLPYTTSDDPSLSLFFDYDGIAYEFGASRASSWCWARVAN